MCYCLPINEQMTVLMQFDARLAGYLFYGFSKLKLQPSIVITLIDFDDQTANTYKNTPYDFVFTMTIASRVDGASVLLA